MKIGRQIACLLNMTTFKTVLLLSILFISEIGVAKSNSVMLIIDPQVLETKIEQENEFIVTGGKAPYTFKTSAGLIRYKDNRAVYIAPNSPGSAIVTVKDSSGMSKEVKVTITSDFPQSTEEN